MRNATSNGHNIFEHNGQNTQPIWGDIRHNLVGDFRTDSPLLDTSDGGGRKLTLDTLLPLLISSRSYGSCNARFGESLCAETLTVGYSFSTINTICCNRHIPHREL